ncbi:MAG: hypothetical protein LUD38_14300, partial [Parabacteroides sp.]|nr:hypothetical protein [Parabacteroides sp.]
MSEYLGRTIEAILMVDRAPRTFFSYNEILLDTIAFRYTGPRRLTYTERRAAATLAWMSANYY